MSRDGTKIYCPKCKAFKSCKVVSPTQVGEPSHRRWKRVDFGDIVWFRRCRICGACGHKFLTAEMEELRISELVTLRERLAEMQKSKVRAIRRRCSWLRKNKIVPRDLAENFIASSAWWLTHSSGIPVNAPRHADRIYNSRLGWALDFGANSFLVGKAIERCGVVINEFLDAAARGQIPTVEEVKLKLKPCITGAVANSGGFEYSGCYPVDKIGLMVFGAQAIDVNSAIDFIIRESEIKGMLLDSE